VGDWASDVIPGGALLLQVVNLAVSLGVATVLFAFIFKVLPSTRIAWRDVWVGAFTTAVLFEIGKYLIGLYLGKSSTTQAFAAAGSLVVLIAWVYYAAQIFLLGAEFTKVYAHEHGSRKAMQMPTANAEEGAPATQAVPEPAAPHKPSLAATARLQETRHRLEVEVPPSAVHLKKVAKGASAAAAGVVALAVVARQLVRSKRGTRATAGLREALGKRAHALAKRAPVLRKRGMLRFGA
jgi:membrane protein